MPQATDNTPPDAHGQEPQGKSHRDETMARRYSPPQKQAIPKAARDGRPLMRLFSAIWFQLGFVVVDVVVIAVDQAGLMTGLHKKLQGAILMGAVMLMALALLVLILVEVILLVGGLTSTHRRPIARHGGRGV